MKSCAAQSRIKANESDKIVQNGLVLAILKWNADVLDFVWLALAIRISRRMFIFMETEMTLIEADARRTILAASVSYPRHS